MASTDITIVTPNGEAMDLPAANIPKGIRFMNELRDLIRQREPDFVWDIAYRHLTIDKDLLKTVPDAELQGVMRAFNYLFPLAAQPQPQLNDSRVTEHEAKQFLELLQDFRTFVRLRMHPAKDMYLSAKDFEEANSGYDLQRSLGPERTRGALLVFNFFHPEEVPIERTEPISFTVLMGPPPTSPARQPRTPFTPNRFRGSAARSTTPRSSTVARQLPVPESPFQPRHPIAIGST